MNQSGTVVNHSSGGPTRRGVFRASALLAGGAFASGTAACGLGGQSISAPAKLTQPASLLFWSILGGADGARMKDMTAQLVKEMPLVQIADTQARVSLYMRRSRGGTRGRTTAQKLRAGLRADENGPIVHRVDGPRT